MNREIKFRAWDGKRYLNEVNINNSGRMIDFDCGEYVGSFDYPIEQYTGLKDKNGKEIYQGDIVRSNNGGKHFWDYEIKSLGGQFGNCLFGILIKDNLTSDEDDNYYTYKETTERAGNRSYVPNGKDIEIIGNIHEELKC